MNIIDIFHERGFIDSSTNIDVLKKVCETKTAVYIGFDPTADSLHLGNLVGIIALTWFQRCGHTPVALLGGATGKIGDPSGKSVERPLLSYEQIEYNVNSIAKQLKQCIGESPVLLNNDEWLSSLSLIDFLRDVGKHFRLGTMLSKESVKTRLHSEEGMSFTEFTYQIMQGYDFYHLNKEHNVLLQIGGSDQWGNITAGIEITRKLAQKEVYGLTFPLLTRSDGKKFGKSEGGAIWLDRKKCSPYAFYQYLFRIPDADCIKMLKMLTFLPIEAINRLEAHLLAGELKPNELQSILAEEVTKFVHGDEGLQSALKVTKALLPGSDTPLDVEILESILDEFPPHVLSLEDVLGKSYADLAVAGKLTASKGEATRLLKNGGAYINNQKVESEERKVLDCDLIGGKFLLVSAGKKKKQILSIG